MIIPPKLSSGDTIAIVSTARKFNLEEITPAIDLMKAWGLNVRLFEGIYGEYNQFAGSDLQRANLLQQAIDDPTVKAILCARGGYGTGRMIDLVNFESLSSRPKWLIGFSDVTVAHMHLQKMGVGSLHATMPLFFNQEGNERALSSMREVLFGELNEISWPHHTLNHQGESEGILFGGNLSVIHSVIDTPSEPSWQNGILFIEDLDEYIYHMDRMFHHIFRTGRLHQLKGIIVGHMSQMKDNKIPFGETVYEIVHRITQELEIPVGFGFPAGHEPENVALLFGKSVALSVADGSSSMSYL